MIYTQVKAISRELSKNGLEELPLHLISPFVLPEELITDLKKRLSFIKGQIEGITKMLDQDKDPRPDSGPV
jgi:hypothetical protein